MDIQQIILAKKREIEAKLNAKSASQDTSLPSAPNASPACSSGHPLLSKPIQFQRLPSNLRTGVESPYFIKEEKISPKEEDVQDQLYHHLMEAVREYRFLLETSSTDPRQPGVYVKDETSEAAFNTPSSSATEVKPFVSVKRESDADETPRSEKKRRSRWGPDPDTAGSSGMAAIPFLPDIKPDFSSASSSGFGIDQQSALQLAQLKQQLAMKESLLKKVGGKAPIDVADATGQPFREHEMRRLEMEKTKEQAMKQTVPLFQGKHHMQDFLPPEELAKFVRKPGQPLAPSTSKEDYEENKLNESNFGYQMLQKFGWTEGAGLGLGSSGITAPVASTGIVERAGLGNTKPGQAADEDDEFTLYRKRMMTAYKYRPNPLNNPRRPYY